MSVWVIVQARLNSERFPRKVLADLNGMPMLKYLIDNLQAADLPICVATPDEEIAQAVVDWDCGAYVVKGPEDDVLARYVKAIDAVKADHVVRITADCPLTQPEMVRQFVEVHLRENADYTTNTLIRSYPNGLDVEVVRSDVLQWGHEALSRKHPDREHVTSWLDIHRPRETSSWRIVNISQRLTVDTPKDLERVRAGACISDSPEEATERACQWPFVEIVSEGHGSPSIPQGQLNW